MKRRNDSGLESGGHGENAERFLAMEDFFNEINAALIDRNRKSEADRLVSLFNDLGDICHGYALTRNSLDNLSGEDEELEEMLAGDENSASLIVHNLISLLQKNSINFDSCNDLKILADKKEKTSRAGESSLSSFMFGYGAHLVGVRGKI